MCLSLAHNDGRLRDGAMPGGGSTDPGGLPEDGALAGGSKRPAAGTGAQSGAEQKTAKRRRAKASAKASAQADSNTSAGRPNAAGSEADGQTGDPPGSGDPVIEAGGQLPLLIQQQRSQQLPVRLILPVGE